MIQNVKVILCIFVVAHAGGQLGLAAPKESDIRFLNEARLLSVAVIQLEIDDRIERGTVQLQERRHGDDHYENIFLLRRDDPSLRLADFEKDQTDHYVMIAPAFFSFSAGGPKRIFGDVGNYDFRMAYYDLSRATEPPQILVERTLAVGAAAPNDKGFFDRLEKKEVWQKLGLTDDFVVSYLHDEGLQIGDFMLLSVLEDIYTQTPIRGRKEWGGLLLDLAEEPSGSAIVPYLAFHASVSSRSERMNTAAQGNQTNPAQKNARDRVTHALSNAENNSDPFIRGFIVTERAFDRAIENDLQNASAMLDESARTAGPVGLDKHIVNVRQMIERSKKSNDRNEK